MLPAVFGFVSSSLPAGPPLQAPAASRPVAAAVSPAPAPSPPAGDSTPGVALVEDLLASLARFDQNGRDPAQKLGFEIPEKAVNEYLAYALRNRPRPGIGAITVTLLPRNEASSVISIDFDAVQKWNPGILPEPLRPLLTGKLALRVNARFESKDGSFTVVLKDVHGPDGKLIPNQVMSDLLRSMGSRQPEQYNPDRPMPLPFGLKRIWTEKQLVCGET